MKAYACVKVSNCVQSNNCSSSFCEGSSGEHVCHESLSIFLGKAVLFVVKLIYLFVMLFSITN